jgi:hypothetical protein
VYNAGEINARTLTLYLVHFATVEPEPANAQGRQNTAIRIGYNRLLPKSSHFIAGKYYANDVSL